MPQLQGLRIEHVALSAHQITLSLRTIRSAACCPLCHRPSRTGHSHYARTIADLPWSGVVVRLHLQVRKFFCVNSTCPRKIFCERVPAVAAPYGRQTPGLQANLRRIGLAVGGQAGARLAGAQGTPTSRTTLLRLVRATPVAASPAPRVSGVDEFALRRRQRYGTLVVDLERHRPVDLWPDQTAESFVSWLRAHPGIAVITRDRSGSFAEAARRGAPAAVQVADRWHLVHNVREVVAQVLTRQQAALRQAAHAVAAGAAATAPTPLLHAPDAPAPEDPPRPAGPLTRAAHQKQANRARRLARYEEVRACHAAGMSLSAIARTLGLGRQTVQNYVRAPGFPERRERAPQPSLLTPYLPYLRQRWAEGCQDATALWRELRALGFTGHPVTVRQHVRPWRAQPLPPGWPQHQAAWRSPQEGPLVPLAPRPVTVYAASWLLVRHRAKLSEDDQAYVQALTECCPEVATTYQVVQAFLTMVRARAAEAFASWLSAAEDSAVPEIAGFAAGLRRDYAAVEAALQLPWSNGQTEGQINRVKMLKRQHYGRANPDLLRQRVLCAG
jgi:transposase